MNKNTIHTFVQNIDLFYFENKMAKYVKCLVFQNCILKKILEIKVNQTLKKKHKVIKNK